MKLFEAFEALDALNEETFTISDDGVEKLGAFMSDNNNVDDIVDVIDPEAETEEELKDSYVGKVILDCCVCHSKLYKGKEDVTLDEEGILANVGEDCPFCYTSDGFKVVGEVAPFEDSSSEEEVVETEEEEVKETEEVTESLTEAKAATLEKPMSKLTGTLSNVLEAHQNELAALASKGDALSFLKKIEPEVKNKSYLNSVIAKVATMPDFKILTFLYNIILKGDGMGKMEGLTESYRADRHRLTAEIFDVLAENGFDVDAEDVIDYAFAASDLAFEEYLFDTEKTIGEIAKEWFANTEANYPEDLEVLTRLDESLEEGIFDKAKENRARNKDKEIATAGKYAIYSNGQKYQVRPINNAEGWESPWVRTFKEAETHLLSQLDDHEKSIYLDSQKHQTGHDNYSDRDVVIITKNENDTKWSYVNGYPPIPSGPKCNYGAVAQKLNKKHKHRDYKSVSYDTAKREVGKPYSENGDFKGTRESLSRELKEGIFSREKEEATHIGVAIWGAGKANKKYAYCTAPGGEDDTYRRIQNLTNRQKENIDYMFGFEVQPLSKATKKVGHEYRKGEEKNWFNIANGDVKESKSIKEGYEPFEDIVNEKFPVAYKKLGRASLEEYIEYFYDMLSPDSIELLCNQANMPIASFETAIEDCYNSYMNESKSIKEDINNLSLDTDDTHMEMSSDENGKVTITTEPINNTEIESEETIVPVSPEVEAEITEEPTEEEVDIEEFDEASFDELGESYLKSIYENVEAFRTTGVSTYDSTLFVEGLITFTSGNTGKTSFEFSAKDFLKEGIYRFTGSNKELSEGKINFELTGKITDKKFICESLTTKE